MILVDTAGRHTLDKELIKEIKDLNKTIKPTELILIMPADIGQAAKQQAQEAIVLAGKANCGKISIIDLKALAVKYNGRTVEISGKVRDIETMYGSGYKFAVDDGTGLITVVYEGSMKDIDDGDDVAVVGVYSKGLDKVAAEKVEKSSIDILPGNSLGIVLILITIIIVIIFFISL